jgi:hypothetical protein
MDPIAQALRSALAADPATTSDSAADLPPCAAALVVGAGGALGSALLAQTLAAGGWAPVYALVAQTLRSTLRGFRPLPESALRDGAAPAIELAFIVFERGRHANGRDAAFVRPEPSDLLPLARRLRTAGVSRLLVVLPHSPALLPQALKAGFATSQEAEVAAVGFEQLVFVRAAQDVTAATAGTVLERFVAWWLSQLRWMVPQREQALRAPVLARAVVRLAQRLGSAPPGTRVVPPELLWLASQPGTDAAACFDRWLHAAAVPTPPR